jgi:hypothetical protein
MNEKYMTFDLFRYQIIPTKTFQFELFNEIQSVEDLKREKNNLFSNAILKNKTYYKGDIKLPFEIKQSDDKLFLLHLGTKKLAHIKDEYFKEIDTFDHPDIYIFIDNNPNTQKIAISRNYKAFSSSFVVAHILEKNFNRILRGFNLSFYLNPIFDKYEFWYLVGNYQDRITSLRFNFIKPNLANISGGFQNDLKDFAEDVNSHKTNFNLNAPEGAFLENISNKNKKLDGLVQYSSEGGGNISVKAKGIRKIFKTNKTVKTIIINELEIKGDEKSVSNIINEYFSE